MSITFQEFARRVCVANHALNHADAANNRRPCPQHLIIATSCWGLCGEAGAKTLAVVNAVADEAGLIAAAERDPHTRAVMALVGKTDAHELTTEDWDRYLSGEMVAAAGARPVGLADVV